MHIILFTIYLAIGVVWAVNHLSGIKKYRKVNASDLSDSSVFLAWPVLCAYIVAPKIKNFALKLINS